MECGIVALSGVASLEQSCCKKTMKLTCWGQPQPQPQPSSPHCPSPSPSLISLALDLLFASLPQPIPNLLPHFPSPRPALGFCLISLALALLIILLLSLSLYVSAASISTRIRLFSVFLVIMALCMSLPAKTQGEINAQGTCLQYKLCVQRYFIAVADINYPLCMHSWS